MAIGTDLWAIKPFLKVKLCRGQFIEIIKICMVIGTDLWAIKPFLIFKLCRGQFSCT